jgi:sterol desaturase/sphingolipid hydroxylase (fatty acid hydroxylase superfamily)
MVASDGPAAGDIAGILILVTYLVMLATERFKSRDAFTAVPRWRWFGLGFLIMLMGLQGLIPEMLPMSWIAEHALLPGGKLGVVGGAIVGFLSITFTDYWVHRAYHRFHLLWRAIHQLHHSPARVDIYGSAFTHPLEVLVMVAQSVVVLVFVLGLDPAAGAIAGYLGAFCAMFQHWNIRTPRWIGYFIQRPEAHCQHHEMHVHAYNYGNLTWWDMLFGTWRNPACATPRVGFEVDRGGRIGAMLIGVDVHADEQKRPYATI